MNKLKHKETKMETYHTRTFLNPKGHKSWANVQCFHGYGNEEDEFQEFKGRVDTNVIIQGCHNSVALHKVTPDMNDFIVKIRTLASELNNFADWLYQHKDDK